MLLSQLFPLSLLTIVARCAPAEGAEVAAEQTTSISTRRTTTTVKPTSTRSPASTIKSSVKTTSTKKTSSTRSTPSPTKQPASCPKYLYIETRGTGLDQGPDPSFINTRNLIDEVVTVEKYYTVYPAAPERSYWLGTRDIVARVRRSNNQCPSTKIILAGMSQGAAATTIAIQRLALDSVAGKSIAAVLVFGNLMHHAKKLSNVDSFGGKSTANVNGIFAAKGEIPTDWDRSGKVMDLCRLNDCICNGTSTVGDVAHLSYVIDTAAAETASKFILQKLGK